MEKVVYFIPVQIQLNDSFRVGGKGMREIDKIVGFRGISADMLFVTIYPPQPRKLATLRPMMHGL